MFVKASCDRATLSSAGVCARLTSAPPKCPEPLPESKLKSLKYNLANYHT